MAKNIVKCSFCGQGVIKLEAQRYKNKNYHSNCAELQKQKDELTEYICRLFSLKAPGPRIYAQIKSYLEKYPYYTYIGIKQALVYFFEIQKKSIDKANQGIGIVPYVYDDAQEYFNRITMRQERVATELSDTLSVAAQEIKIKKQEKKKKNLYDMENL
jgi:hypothetical protein